MEHSNTFKQVVHYVNKGIGGEGHAHIVLKKQQVEACFKSLDRLDETQHKLAMKIVRTFSKFTYKAVEAAPGEKLEEGKRKVTVEMDSEAVYDLTKAFILSNSVYTPEYTELVRNEILADAGAMYTFGMWMLTEHAAPFFLSFQET